MTKVRSKSNSAHACALLSLIVSMLGFAGCNGGSEDNNPNVGAGHSDGSTLDPSTPDNPPIDPLGPPPNANTLTLAVKYVALRPDANTAASPTKEEVTTLLANIAKVWSQCDIRFALESFESPIAADDGLSYYPANHWQLDDMREKYDDNLRLLLVKTGVWNRNGDLGYDGSNGFSTLPPAGAEGAVFEKGVATSTMLIAHEIGHLIGGLGHTSGTNLMNHFVSAGNVYMTTSQCDYTRNTIKRYHPEWLR